MSSSSDPRPTPVPAGSRTLALVVAAALFMENMDSTVLATALPVVATDLGVDPLSLKLALTSYLVSLAIFIPPSGWMADRFGARRVFAAAMAVFLAGSVACAAANGLAWLVAARFVQGMGGAMMVPVGRMILARATPKADLVGAMAWLTVPALIGPVLGPLVGGWIVTHADWRWIFLVNLPFGAAGIALALGLLPRGGETDPGPFDWWGFGLAAAALSCLMLGSMEVTAAEGLSAATLGLLAAGLAAGAVAVRHCLTGPAPMLDLRLLSRPTYRASVLGGFLFRVGVGAIPFLLPLMLQVGFGLSALQSGALTFVAALGALVAKPFNSWLLRRLTFRAVLAANGVLAAGSIAAMGLFTAATPHAMIYAVLFLGGVVRSVQFTALNAIAYADLAPAEMARATSLAAAAQQVSLGLGVTLGAAVLAATMRWNGAEGLAGADWGLAFALVGLAAAVSVPWFLRLPRAAGAALAGR
jgi:EmrB/QacA subfamily drug resistance transporter